MVKYLPSSATRQISIIEVEYPTTTTIIYPPVGAQYEQGIPFTFSGTLTYKEGGVDRGLEGFPVALKYNETSLGSVTTGIDGAWSASVIIPTVGAFTLTASFAGAAGLGASEATRGIAAEAVNPLLLLALLAGGYFLLKR